MNTHHSFNIVGKTAHFFAENKPLSLLTLVAVLGFGLFSFFLTPKQYNPEIVRPAFALSLQYSGATTDEAVNRVVYELVEKVSAVLGVDEVITEVRDGAYIGTTVIFDVGYDKTKAKVDLMAQIESHSYLAQGFINKPQIIEINPETIPILQIVFSSPSLSIADVRSKVTEISHELIHIKNVSDASIIGGYKPQLVVEIDPIRMSHTDVTVKNITQALAQGESRVVISGFNGEKEKIGIVFDGQVSTPENIGALTVLPNVRIRDIATVYKGPTATRSFVLHDTKDIDPSEIVMLSMSKVEGSSAPEVTKAIHDKLNTLLTKDAYKSLTYTIVNDDGVTATEEINGLTNNLLQSIGIVALVLILFLSIRVAFIVLIAIPTTLLIVFGIGYIFGETINRITLFALILSLGLLVDATIVVVENMYVHLRNASENLINATREIIIAGSVNEIGVGLFLSTITSVIVFLPVGYITGMMGPYIGPIAFFVPVALIVSMFVAIIIVPYIAVYILHPDEKQTKLSALIDRHTQRLIKNYRTLIQKIVRKRSLQKTILFTMVGLFLFVLIFPLIGLEYFQMLPKADRNQFYVYIDTPVDSTLKETRRITTEVASCITEDSDVVSIQQFIGVPPIVDFNGMFKGAQYRGEKYQATFRVNITGADKRHRSSTDIVTDIRRTLLTTHPEYAKMTRFIEEPPGPPVRATLVAMVSSDNETRTKEAVQALAPYIAKTEGVVDPFISYNEPTSNISYTFDHEKAASLGVSEFDVRDALSLLNDDIPVTEYMEKNGVEFTPVTLTVTREGKNEPVDVNAFTVPSVYGNLIPITSVLVATNTARLQSIYLERGKMLTYITGEVEGRPVIYVVIDIISGIFRGEVKGYNISHFGLFDLTLKNEKNEEIELTWGGEWKMTLENFRDLGVAMAVALILVYATLVAQCRTFKKPIFVMITIPLSLIGILTGFLFLDNIFGIYLTATALIGFIALIGIVVNNAIIFSEYVDQRVEAGVPYIEAIVEAGGARFRPIMLTSLTTILGSLTIASDPVWSGLAWSIVFGLSLSTTLTLIVYPTLLVFFHTQEK